MASKGRWSRTQTDWERVYWKRTLPREERLSPWGAAGPTPEQVQRASERARAICARYKRMKRRRSRTR